MKKFELKAQQEGEEVLNTPFKSVNKAIELIRGLANACDNITFTLEVTTVADTDTSGGSDSSDSGSDTGDSSAESSEP